MRSSNPRKTPPKRRSKKKEELRYEHMRIGTDPNETAADKTTAAQHEGLAVLWANLCILKRACHRISWIYSCMHANSVYYDEQRQDGQHHQKRMRVPHSNVMNVSTTEEHNRKNKQKSNPQRGVQADINQPELRLA